MDKQKLIQAGYCPYCEVKGKKQFDTKDIEGSITIIVYKCPKCDTEFRAIIKNLTKR